MFKTFVIGIFLGVLGAGAAVYLVPAVDLHRERSLIEVQANGGNIEEFSISLPRDRILLGSVDTRSAIPTGLEWPGGQQLDGLQAELFKVRNREDAIIGVASRMASATEEKGSFVEWTLHFPARGTVYARMQPSPTVDGFRNGRVRGGTRDFEHLTGTARERHVAMNNENSDSQGRIELQVALVAPLIDEEPLDEEQDDEAPGDKE